MTTLLSIDPGGKGAGETGIVLLEFDDSTAARVNDSWAVTDAFDGFRRWHNNELWLEPDIVVCEHFVNYNTNGADLTPCFIEGAVRWIWPDVVLQPASGKNSLVPDRVLKKMGMWFPGDHHHDRREAGRHALIYMRNIRHEPTLEAMYK